MEGMYIGIIILCLVFLLLTQIQMYRQKKEIRQAVEDIQHFLLYPEEVKEEYLEEGYVYNLMNQVLKLESQILYDRSVFQRRETQTNCFIENMAHQIKTAITALHIRMDFSLEICETPKQREALEKSRQCLDRLTGEVERLLITSRLASGNVMIVFEKVDIESLLVSCAENLSSLAMKEQAEIQIDGHIPVDYYGDSFWLEQAFENVIKNALEHTYENTTVQIYLEYTEHFVKIRIEDNGPGIPDDEKEALFERFCRGNSTKKGYGIGLSMAKDIIRLHHGTIIAGNGISCGAWFLITLPVLNGTEPYKTVMRAEREL